MIDVKEIRRLAEHGQIQLTTYEVIELLDALEETEKAQQDNKEALSAIIRVQMTALEAADDVINKIDILDRHKDDYTWSIQWPALLTLKDSYRDERG